MDRKYIAIGLIVIVFSAIAAAIIALPIDLSKIEFGPRKVSFTELCLNKENYYKAWESFWFENGTIVWFNETQGIKVAIIVPLPLPKKVELGEEDYIAAKVPVSLKVGDKVNVEGVIKKAGHENKKLYYLDASGIVKTGTIDVADPDFQNIMRVIAEKEREEDWILDWLIWWYTVFLPIISQQLGRWSY